MTTMVVAAKQMMLFVVLALLVLVAPSPCWGQQQVEPQIEAKSGSLHLHAQSGDVHMHTSLGSATWTDTVNDIASLQGQVQELRRVALQLLAQTPVDVDARFESLAQENAALRQRMDMLEGFIAAQREDIALLQTQVRDLDEQNARVQPLIEPMATVAEAVFGDLGFPRGWSGPVATVVPTENERQAWIATDPQITETSCVECTSPPYYIHGPNGGRDSYALSFNTFLSFMHYKYPDRLPVDGIRRADTAGLLRGQSLFISGNQLRGETDTNCPQFPNGWCTGESMSAADIYVSTVRAVAPTTMHAPATQPIFVPNTNGSLDITDKLTVEVWVKCLTPPRPQPDGRTYAPLLTKNGRIGVNQDTFAMYHVVGVYDGRDLVVYVNGVEQGRTTIGAVVAYTGPEAMVIGSNKHTNHGSKGSVHAILDEVAVWNRVLDGAEVAASVFVPITDRQQTPTNDNNDDGSSSNNNNNNNNNKLVAYINFEQPEQWLDLSPMWTETASGAELLRSQHVPDVGPLSLNASTANLVLVPSVDQSQHAAFFYDEDLDMEFFPRVPDGEYVAFVSTASLQCETDAGCLCNTSLLVNAASVWDNTVTVQLRADNYHVCHSFTGEPDTFYMQPGPRVSAVDLDPCFGVTCGSHGACRQGACVCTDGYTGDLCHLPPPVFSNNGTTPQQPARSCADVADLPKAAGLYFVSDDPNAPVAGAASPALCLQAPNGVDAYRVASVIASPTGTTMAALTRAGGLSAVNELSTSATFAQPLSSAAFDRTAVACLDADERVVEATLTPVHASTFSRFVSGAWSYLSQETAQNGTIVTFTGGEDSAPKTVTIETAQDTQYTWSDAGFVCAGLPVTRAWRLAILVA
ncbi:hypothetical protein PTSG_09037 [Salpingoeca rosetta]|uniref:EGF-like domain-containing protein n=1 Tax=Salpingoeca rosetta (strain ATCC 50818 / BSB-021) TaxID=946362 RepID=F2UM12_SALR5|nr:uncharacterized protein PTSG_09037 [Salpingoeca rosetta]EGD78161.1 hypothetical protein PTSG_09037 [Salpingoeca rosetta]|eukprot:XP_004989837.1 hypothetical protein PTSG_09037 [Salpingoeca rosetta]